MVYIRGHEAGMIRTTNMIDVIECEAVSTCQGDCTHEYCKHLV